MTQTKELIEVAMCMRPMIAGAAMALSSVSVVPAARRRQAAAAIPHASTRKYIRGRSAVATQLSIADHALHEGSSLAIGHAE